LKRRHFALVLILFAVSPNPARAQAGAITDLLSAATDFDFFWTRVGSPRGSMKPERDNGASGVGFELAFGIPGGLSRHRVVPSVRSARPSGSDCESKFARGELRQGQACADTSVVSVKRTTVRGSQSPVYEEQLEVSEFKWREPVLTFELAVGFSQTGAFVPRNPTNDIRVTVREAPSVSLYADYEPELPILGNSFTAYTGGRTGLVDLVGGRAYRDGDNIKLDGETFQIGPVLGFSTALKGINFFVEGAYMWRQFKTLDWDTTGDLGTLPRSLDLSGPAISIGAQFSFRKSGD
jgi:hypothetical protein